MSAYLPCRERPTPGISGHVAPVPEDESPRVRAPNLIVISASHQLPLPATIGVKSSYFDDSTIALVVESPDESGQLIPILWFVEQPSGVSR